MLSPEHCLVRAERLRIAMLTAPDSIAETRLRGFVHKYKDLAGRAKLTLIPPLVAITKCTCLVLCETAFPVPDRRLCLRPEARWLQTPRAWGSGSWSTARHV
jgi:hypothetical protein